MLPTSGKLLLELGAGAGRNTPRYAGFERVVLLDYSLTQLQQAQERLGRSERYVYVAADIYRLPFVPGLFDTATMIRTLHHMADAPVALRQVRRVLQPGSIFILEFANKRNLKAILRYVCRRQKWSPFTLAPVEFTTLNFDFHPKAVRQWLADSGFDIECILTVSHFRMGLLKRLLPLKLLVAMDSVLQPTGRCLQVSPSVFVRSRATASSPSPAASGFFACPECGHSLPEATPNGVSCPGCGRSWPLRDGIYDFRAEFV